MSKVIQEFYCTVSGGGCGGYITIKLNIGLNRVIKLICPKCGHSHQRHIKDGVILEDGRYSSGVIEEIVPTIGAWSETSRYSDLRSRRKKIMERDGLVVGVSDDFLSDSLFERFGDR